MTAREQKAAAKAFAERWVAGGKENQHTQTFWLEFLRDVYGIECPEELIEFEKPVAVYDVETGETSNKRIDEYLKDTLVLIEQKDSGKSLTKRYKQSDGKQLDAFGQAVRYERDMIPAKRPRWIVTCNFLEFRIHDIRRLSSDPEIIRLNDLPEQYEQLSFW